MSFLKNGLLSGGFACSILPVDLASKYNKEPAQVIVRYSLQKVGDLRKRAC